MIGFEYQASVKRASAVQLPLTPYVPHNHAVTNCRFCAARVEYRAWRIRNGRATALSAQCELHRSPDTLPRNRRDNALAERDFFA